MNGFVEELGLQFEELAVAETDRRKRRRRAAGFISATAVVLGIAGIAWSMASRPAVELQATSDPTSGAESTVASTEDRTSTTQPITTTPETTTPETTTAEPTTAEPTTAETTTPAGVPALQCLNPVEARWSDITNPQTQLGPQNWIDGVAISAYAADGAPADLFLHEDAPDVEPRFGVAGGRYDGQIDYLPSLEATERIVLTFDQPLCEIDLGVLHLEGREREGFDELLVWQARGADEADLSDGVLIRADGRLADGGIWFSLDIPAGTTIIELSAAPYADGVATPEGNESDYSILGIRIS